MSESREIESILALAEAMNVATTDHTKPAEVTQSGLKTIDTDILTKGVTAAIAAVRTSFGARQSAWCTVVDACEQSNLMHPDVPEHHARSALIDVGNQIQWYKDSHVETVAALTSSTWRTIQSDILLAKQYTIPLTRLDEDGKPTARGKTSVERDIKSRKLENKRENGSESVTALTNLNGRIGGAMVAANNYINVVKDGPIKDWCDETLRRIESAKTSQDEDKELSLAGATIGSQAIVKELATVIASIDLVRDTLSRTLGEFNSQSDAASLRAKVYAGTWEEKAEDEEAEPDATPTDQWAEAEDE